MEGLRRRYFHRYDDESGELCSVPGCEEPQGLVDDEWCETEDGEPACEEHAGWIEEEQEKEEGEDV